jgi:hypothetical protein
MNAAQKFCTQDGTPLLNTTTLPSSQGETIRIDSAGLNVPPFDDEATRVISRDLTTGDLDPYKTMVNEPRAGAPTPPIDPEMTIPAMRLPIETPAPSGPIEPPPMPPPTRPLDTPQTGTLPDSAPLPPPPSAPLPQPPQAEAPPTVSASLPPPVSAPAPPPAQAPAAAAPQVYRPSPPVAAPKPGRKSKLPLVLGILAVLLLLLAGGGVAAYFLVLAPMLEARRVKPEPTPAPTPIVASSPTPEKNVVKEVPPYSAPEDAVQFVNSADKLDGKLKEHYVDFSFYYPQRWQKDPQSGVAGATNFAKVVRQLAADAPQEIFSVGWYESTGSPESDQLSYPRLVEQKSSQFAKDYPEYQKVSEGPTKAGVYDGYEFRFAARYRNTDRGDVDVWGRVIFVAPTDGSKRGVTLMMLASSLTDGVRGAADVGVKGELPITLESFRFGK